MASSLSSATGSVSPSKRLSRPSVGTNVSAMSDEFGSESACPQEWMGDTNNCTICKAKLGKRVMNPRHHCRVCGRCVCNKCSPSITELEGLEGPQRVCKTCVKGAFQDAKAGLRAKARLEEIATQMWEVAGTDIFEFEAEDVDEAVTACAAATDGIERKMLEVRGQLSKIEARASNAEAELVEARLAKDKAEQVLIVCRDELSEAEAAGFRERTAREELQQRFDQCCASLAEAERRANSAEHLAERRKAEAAEAAAAASATAKRLFKPSVKQAEKTEAHPSQATTTASEGDSSSVSVKPGSSLDNSRDLGRSLPNVQPPPQSGASRAGKCATGCVAM